MAFSHVKPNKIISFKKIAEKVLTIGTIWIILSKQSQISDTIWGLSSAGRASALQAEGHRFEPCRPHHHGGIAQLARAHGSYPWCREFESPFRYFKAFDSSKAFLFFSYLQ